MTTFIFKPVMDTESGIENGRYPLHYVEIVPMVGLSETEALLASPRLPDGSRDVYALFESVTIYLTKSEIEEIENIYKSHGKGFIYDNYREIKFKRYFPIGEVPEDLNTSPAPERAMKKANPELCPRCGYETAEVGISKRKDLGLFTTVRACLDCMFHYYTKDGVILDKEYDEP